MNFLKRLFGFTKPAQKPSLSASADIRWVMDFNLQLGVELGGVIGVFNVFSDAKGMLEKFMAIMLKDVEFHRQGMSANLRAEFMAESFNRSYPREVIGLMKKYHAFYCDAFPRLINNAAFREWVKSSSFSIMPDMFTHAVLKFAVKLVEARSA